MSNFMLKVLMFISCFTFLLPFGAYAGFQVCGNQIVPDSASMCPDGSIPFFIAESLSVTPAGTGTGTVIGSWSGTSYSSGTLVTLIATADSGSTFTGWSGGCSSQNASAACGVTMSTTEAVIAHYVIAGTTSFNDVPSGSTFESYIEAIYNNGITVGCQNGNYCPSGNVTRGQMAAFIIRALYGENFTYTPAPYYVDEPSTDVFFKYVQKMKDLKITTTTDNYLPNNNVTREQMAAFLVRATQSKAGQDTENFTYTTTPYFTDMPTTDIFFKYVQKLKDVAITTVAGTYDATSNVTREQMAAFIARAFLGMKGVSTANPADFYFGVWRTSIPGAVWTSPSGYQGSDWLNVMAGVSVGDLIIRPDGTYVWNSYGGKSGTWISGDAEFPIVLIDTVENKQWKVGSYSQHTGGPDIFVWDGYVWYDGRK